MLTKAKNHLLFRPLFVIAFLTMSGCEQKAPPPPAPLMEIPFVTVTTQDVDIPLDVVGETVGSKDVTIRSRVDGFIDGIHFKEGTFVEKGALLYTIDPQSFQEKVAQAKAGLAQANTQLAKAKADLERVRPLAEMKAVSAQDLDSAVASYDAARSYVDVNKSQVELANIELSYTRIHSPDNGLIGLSEFEVGDFVSQATQGGLLNVVSRTNPIGVRVAITEKGYITAARRLAEGHKKVVLAENQAEKNPLTLILADGSIYEHQGYPTKIDRNIDSATGTLTIEAEFPNEQELLRPGMFARVRFNASKVEGAVLLPQRAISELQSAHRVFVIKEDDTIEIRQIQVGPRLGSNWLVEAGLNPGDRVAIEGLLRMRPDMKVKPRPAQAGDLPPVKKGN